MLVFVLLCIFCVLSSFAIIWTNSHKFEEILLVLKLPHFQLCSKGFGYK